MLFLLAVVALLVAPGAAFYTDLTFELDARGCVISYKDGENYFPPSRRAMFVKDDVGLSENLAYSQYFSIEYFNTFKVLRDSFAKQVYVLHQCGTPLSSMEGHLPVDAINATVFSVPVTSWSTSTTVTIGFGEELNLFNLLDSADLTYVSSPCLQKMYACGDVKHDEPKYSWEGQEYQDYIDTIEESSLLHFVSGDIKDLAHDVVFSATQDPSLLGRVEWLKFISAFFNEEPEANREFRDIERSLNSISERIGDYVRANPQPTPVIAFVSFENSSWSCTGKAEWGVALPEYKKEGVLKTGGRPVAIADLPTSDWQGSCWCADPSAADCNRITNSVAAMQKLLKGVDVVVDETYVNKTSWYSIDNFYQNFQISADETDTYRFLKNRVVLRTDATIGQALGDGKAEGTDWFEGAVVRADRVVYELASYIYPEVCTPLDHTTGHYEADFIRNLATGEEVRKVDDTDLLDPYCVCEDEAGPAPMEPVYNDCIDNTCIIQDLSTLPFPPPPPPKPPSPPSPPSPPPPNPMSPAEASALPGWAIGVIVAVGVIAALLVIFIIAMISRERAGAPIFKTFDDIKASGTAQA